MHHCVLKNYKTTCDGSLWDRKSYQKKNIGPAWYKGNHRIKRSKASQWTLAVFLLVILSLWDCEHVCYIMVLGSNHWLRQSNYLLSFFHNRFFFFRWQTMEILLLPIGSFEQDDTSLKQLTRDRRPPQVSKFVHREEEQHSHAQGYRPLMTDAPEKLWQMWQQLTDCQHHAHLQSYVAFWFPP